MWLSADSGEHDSKRYPSKKFNQTVWPKNQATPDSNTGWTAINYSTPRQFEDRYGYAIKWKARRRYSFHPVGSEKAQITIITKIQLERTLLYFLILPFICHVRTKISSITQTNSWLFPVLSWTGFLRQSMIASINAGLRIVFGFKQQLHETSEMNGSTRQMWYPANSPTHPMI